jgi:beta-1,4-mannosyl-glycoprotein beta-1,4-N-acetylglucosaminyltransferase
MKIIDCFMYFDEDMILDLRLNILNKYVSHFIICEATFNHKGLKKKLNFNINNFSKFKDKITYIVLDKEPSNIKKINFQDSKTTTNSKILDNSINRDIGQRNHLNEEIKKYNDEDLILLNDIDEIPNLEIFNYQNKITIFKQKMIYYKFNLVYPNFFWMGSKICKKKHLYSPQWLRNIKPKKYPWWRADILLSKKKYMNVDFVENGGWHFSNIKTPEEIDFKMKNFAHHLEYEESGMSIEKLKKNIKEKKVFYNHFADKSASNKLGYEAKLENLELSELPEYLHINKVKYKNWFNEN